MAMVWWILTYLDNYRARTSLTVLAETNLQAHLFMKWATTRPARRAVYKRVRGVNIWCGYEYIWDTPNLVEQSQPGNTFEHLFGLIPLAPTDHVWYYLFSIREAPYKECQGPLIHVSPWETTMPSCRVRNSLTLTIPTSTDFLLTFDTERWDDGGFHNPAQPSILRAPIPGLYEVGAAITFDTMIGVGFRLFIQFNAGQYILRHGHHTGPNGWEGTGLSMHTIWPFAPNDIVQLRVYHNRGSDAYIISENRYSPEFWINYIGPNPT